MTQKRPWDANPLQCLDCFLVIVYVEQQKNVKPYCGIVPMINYNCQNTCVIFHKWHKVLEIKMLRKKCFERLQDDIILFARFHQHFPPGTKKQMMLKIKRCASSTYLTFLSWRKAESESAQLSEASKLIFIRNSFAGGIVWAAGFHLATVRDFLSLPHPNLNGGNTGLRTEKTQPISVSISNSGETVTWQRSK